MSSAFTSPWFPVARNLNDSFRDKLVSCCEVDNAKS